MSDEKLAPRYIWPPTKQDLRHLYLDERLSAAKIADVYGRKTPNPRSAWFLIRYYLMKYGIPMRNRVEELAKDTAEAAEEWTAKYPPGGGGDQQTVVIPGGVGGSVEISIALSFEERAVLELLRATGLSIRHLDPAARKRVYDVMENFNLKRQISLTDISLLIGNKTSGYASYLFKQLGIKPRPFEESRRKEITAKLRTHQRSPFDGTDEDKAYLLGVSHGDFHVMRPFGDAVRVSTGTTHPAMVELFATLFARYGHVSVSEIQERYRQLRMEYSGNPRQQFRVPPPNPGGMSRVGGGQRQYDVGLPSWPD